MYLYNIPIVLALRINKKFVFLNLLIIIVPIFLELLLNNDDQSFFFVFGAGHFVGNNSVIHLVRKAGNTIGRDGNLSNFRLLFVFSQ